MVATIKFAPELDFPLVTLNPATVQYVSNEITRTESLGAKATVALQRTRGSPEAIRPSAVSVFRTH